MIDENYLNENSLNNEAIKTKEKHPLFTFAKISNLYLIPFMAPLFWLIINFLRTKYVEDYNKDNENKIKFLLFVLFSLAQIFGGSFYFIIKKFQNPVKKNECNENIDKYRTTSLIIKIYEKSQKERLMKSIKITAVITLIGSIGDKFQMIVMDDVFYDSRLFFLIFTCLFSVIYLNKKIYNHQTISLSISIIGMLIALVGKFISGSDPNNQQTLKWYQLLPISFAIGITHAFELVISKHIMENLFVPPLKYIFISGIFKLIYEFVTDFFYCLITGEEKKLIFTSIKYAINENKIVECISFLILIFISAAIFHVLVYLTNYYFSTILLVITDLLSPLLLLIFIKLFTDDSKTSNIEFIFTIIGHIICIIALVFYNELIICNFCGLNENTIENIHKRGLDDQKKCLDRKTNASNESKDNSDFDLEQ